MSWLLIVGALYFLIVCSSVSSSILPSLCLSSEDDVMPEAMCEMPVLSPQVMFDGSPPSHTSSWEDYTEMRRVSWTWDTFVEYSSSY